MTTLKAIFWIVFTILLIGQIWWMIAKELSKNMKDKNGADSKKNGMPSEKK